MQRTANNKHSCISAKIVLAGRAIREEKNGSFELKG